MTRVSPDRLTPNDREHWRLFRARDPRYRSPFFSLEFTAAVDRARGDVEVLRVNDGDSPIAFLPLHRLGSRAYPVGRFFNDAHNLICDPNVVLRWEPLLEAAGLSSFEFHALVGSQPNEFPEQTCYGSVRSFRCEIGGDPHAYLERLGRNHKTIGRQPQKTRKLQREVGPVSFEFDCRDHDLLLRTIEMKSRQYRRTHTLDLFSPRWTARLLNELFVASTDRDPVRSFDGRQAGGRVRGVLSVLRAGDRMVAAHYGLLEGGWLHYWFPVYDPQFAKYSPGTALFRFLLETAGEHGLSCIDMGYGEQPYKWKQTDASGSVLQGCLSSSTLYRHYRSTCRRFVATAKRIPGKEPIKRLWRSVWPDAGISKLR